jgi:hypothetical protein
MKEREIKLGVDALQFLNATMKRQDSWLDHHDRRLVFLRTIERAVRGLDQSQGIRESPEDFV